MIICTEKFTLILKNIFVKLVLLFSYFYEINFFRLIHLMNNFTV